MRVCVRACVRACEGLNVSPCLGHCTCVQYMDILMTVHPCVHCPLCSLVCGQLSPVHLSVCVCMRECNCGFVYVCEHACVCVYVWVGLCGYLGVCVYAQVCVCVWVMIVSVCVCE